ncbi:MAG TPA: DUF3253 domain-containing protein [Dokdonella sp.]|uniref:DUF3253 domain-containing protein n=1 Tax=Dokdonella sp. TaxID=2291710 RepID=UPI0025C57500|nr:DUF3253 domain-containing protein [Dokdonella sp.]MBX3692872.1 DUF3253 domain-containing protein [Dokdonella sp.]MCW5566651.1 DUF3253 domain-containing protein [Dokdonella sp.]HNR91934.1 DUF3253 domain-containing protein [Dokdonella sp.]
MTAHLHEDTLAQRIRECIFALLDERGHGRSIAVAEVAQAVGLRCNQHWHDLMRPIRAVASELVDRGMLEALQSEVVVDIRDARGPVRLRLRSLPGQRSAVRS